MMQNPLQTPSEPKMVWLIKFYFFKYLDNFYLCEIGKPMI